jgi:hypothetical protein
MVLRGSLALSAAGYGWAVVVLHGMVRYGGFWLFSFGEVDCGGAW